VVSIHTDDPDGHRMRIGMGPNARFVAEGVTIKRLVCMAYGIQDFQLEGAPNWFTGERFSIQAKSESDVEEQFPKLTDEQKMMVGKQMVQAMLADRFKLSLRQESKEVPILGIVADKNGPKLHEAKLGDTYPNGLKDGNGAGHAGMMTFNGTHLTAQGVKLDNLASFLSGQLNQIVQNKTGLDGKYDFTLDWSSGAGRPEGPARVGEHENATDDGNSETSIFTAIKEQLGLKLESQKSAVPVYVVVKAEKPSEN
jgi:bla regulator protein BlaR1